MESLLYSVAVLACPVGMGVMMWVMARGQRANDVGRGGRSTDGQVGALRVEVDRLKSERAAPGGR